MLWAGGYPMMLSESLRRHAHGFFALLTFLTFLAPMGAALYHGLIRRVEHGGATRSVVIDTLPVGASIQRLLFRLVIPAQVGTQ